MSETTEDPPGQFLIEEYKNIAATHDNTRDLLTRHRRVTSAVWRVAEFHQIE
jgi:hypothetical protein